MNTQKLVEQIEQQVHDYADALTLLHDCIAAEADQQRNVEIERIAVIAAGLADGSLDGKNEAERKHRLDILLAGSDGLRQQENLLQAITKEKLTAEAHVKIAKFTLSALELLVTVATNKDICQNPRHLLYCQ